MGQGGDGRQGCEVGVGLPPLGSARASGARLGVRALNHYRVVVLQIGRPRLRRVLGARLSVWELSTT